VVGFEGGASSANIAGTEGVAVIAGVDGIADNEGIVMVTVPAPVGKQVPNPLPMLMGRPPSQQTVGRPPVLAQAAPCHGPGNGQA
jgi:hypothetical protein